MVADFRVFFFFNRTRRRRQTRLSRNLEKIYVIKHEFIFYSSVRRYNGANNKLYNFNLYTISSPPPSFISCRYIGQPVERAHVN